MRPREAPLLGPLPAPPSRGEEEEKGGRREGCGSGVGMAGAGIPGSRSAFGAFMLVRHTPKDDDANVHDVIEWVNKKVPRKHSTFNAEGGRDVRVPSPRDGDMTISRTDPFPVDARPNG